MGGGVKSVSLGGSADATLETSEILTPLPHFRGPAVQRKHLEYSNDQTGSGKSKMAAEPEAEILISQLAEVLPVQ